MIILEGVPTTQAVQASLGICFVGAWPPSVPVRMPAYCALLRLCVFLGVETTLLPASAYSHALCSLWGVTFAQTIFYLYHFPRDGRFRKYMVSSPQMVSSRSRTDCLAQVLCMRSVLDRCYKKTRLNSRFSIVDCAHLAFISSLFWDMLIYNRFNHVDAREAIGHPWSACSFRHDSPPLI